MSTRIYCLALFSLTLLPVSRTQAAIRQLEITNPRSFGYVIGDVIERRISLDLEAPYRLDADSFPDSGRMNRWLDLRRIESSSQYEAGGTLYTVTVAYQIVDIPENMQQLSIPELALTYGNGEQDLVLTVTPWRFTVTPLIAGKGEREYGFVDLQPDRVPPPVAIGRHVVRLVFMAVAMLTAVLVLIYTLTGLPLLSRSRGPFARACRQLKRYAQTPNDEFCVPEAMRCVHQAFNLTAGRVLFADQLESFFAQKRAFAGLREPIEDFYESSRSVFYGSENKAQTTRYAMDRLLELCRNCRDVERGLS